MVIASMFSYALAVYFFTLQPVYSLDCALGTYQSPQNDETCVDCPAGRWSDVQGLTASFQCKYCVAGRYSLESGKQDDTHCKACDKGRYADHRGSVECSNCTAGRYAPNVGTVVCEACSGTVVDRTSCLAQCEIGYEFQTKDNVCLDCPPGSHPVNGVCLDCPVGRFSDISGSTACVQCPAGYLSSETRDSCGFCQPGQYQDALTNVLSCTSCEPGRHQPDTGKTVCLGDLCPQGQFGTLGNVAECYECIPGRFQADTGQTECELCPSGKHQRNVGFNTCDDCPGNTMGSSSNSAKGQIECGAGCPAGAECSPIEMTTTLPWHQVGVSEFHLDLGTDPNATVAELTKDSNVSYSVNIGGWNDAYNVFDGVKRNVYCEYDRFYSKWSCSDLKPFNWEWEKYICQDCYSYKDLYGNVHHELQAWLQNRSFEVDTSTLDYESLPMSVNTWARKTFYKPDLKRPLRVVSTRTGRRDETHAPVPIKVFKTLFEPEGSGSSIADAMEGMSSDTELAAGTQQLTSDYTFNLHAGTKTNKGYTVVQLPFGNTYSGGQINDIDTFVNELRNIMTRFTIERKYNVITFVVKKETNGVPYNIRVDSCDIGSILVQGACAKCAVGKYGTEGATVCTECGTGLYQNEQGESSCKTCPPGTESKNKNIRDCANCPVGKYSDNRILFCEFCPKGYYQVDPAQLQCLKCSANTYGDETGLKSVEECKQCPVGSISKEASVSATDCAFRPDCPIGKYLSPRQDGCVKCPPGRYSNVTGLTKVGQLYQPLTQEEKACTGCPSGYFQNEHGQTSCKATSAGYYEPDALEISDELVDKHHPCPAGRYSSATGLASVDDCTKCPQGYFQDETSATSCKICELGKQSDIVGSESEDWCEMCPSGQYSNVRGAHGHAFPSVKFEFLDGDLTGIDAGHMNRVFRGSRAEITREMKDIYWRESAYRFTRVGKISDMFQCNSTYKLQFPNESLAQFWTTKRRYNVHFNGAGTFDQNIESYFMRHVEGGEGTIYLPLLSKNDNKVHYRATETSVVYTFDLAGFLKTFDGTFPPPFDVNQTVFDKELNDAKNNLILAAFNFLVGAELDDYGFVNHTLVTHPKKAPAGVFKGGIMKYVPKGQDTGLDTSSPFFNMTYSYDIKLYRKVYRLKTWDSLVEWFELGEDVSIFLPTEFYVIPLEKQSNLTLVEIINQSIPEKPDGHKWYKWSSSGSVHLFVSNNEEHSDDLPYLSGNYVEDLTLFPKDIGSLLNQLNYFDRGKNVENDYSYFKEDGDYDGAVDGNSNYYIVANAKVKGPSVRSMIDVFDWRLVDSGVHKKAIYATNETMLVSELQKLLAQPSNYSVCFAENVTMYDVAGLDFDRSQTSIEGFLQASESFGFSGNISGHCVYLQGNLNTPELSDDSSTMYTNVETHTPMFKTPELPDGFKEYNASRAQKYKDYYLKGWYELSYLRLIADHTDVQCKEKLIRGEERLACVENLPLPDNYYVLDTVQQSADAFKTYELKLTDDDVLYKYEDQDEVSVNGNPDIPCCDICDACTVNVSEYGYLQTVPHYVRLLNDTLPGYEITSGGHNNGLYTILATAYTNGKNIVPLTDYSENNDIDIKEVVSDGRHSHREFPFITLADGQKPLYIDQQYNSSAEIFHWLDSQQNLTSNYTITFDEGQNEITFVSKTSGEMDETIDCCLSAKTNDDEQLDYVFDAECEKFKDVDFVKLTAPRLNSDYDLSVPPIYNVGTLMNFLLQDTYMKTYWSCTSPTTESFVCTAVSKGPGFELTLTEDSSSHFELEKTANGTTNADITRQMYLETLIKHVETDLEAYNSTITTLASSVELEIITPPRSDVERMKQVYGMRRKFDGPSFGFVNGDTLPLIDGINSNDLTGQTLYDSIDKEYVTATLARSESQYYEPAVVYPYVFEKPSGFNEKDYYYQCREHQQNENEIECSPYLNFTEYNTSSTDFFNDKGRITCKQHTFEMPTNDKRVFFRFYFDLSTCRQNTMDMRADFIAEYHLVLHDDPEWQSSDGEKFTVRYNRLVVDNIYNVHLRLANSSSSVPVKRFDNSSVSKRCLRAPRYIYNNNFDDIRSQLIVDGVPMVWIPGFCNDYTRPTKEECFPQFTTDKGCCPIWENGDQYECWPEDSPNGISTYVPQALCGKINWLDTGGGFCPDGSTKNKIECTNLDPVWTDGKCSDGSANNRDTCIATTGKVLKPITIALYDGTEFIIKLNGTHDAKERIFAELKNQLTGIYTVTEEEGRLYLQMDGDIVLQKGIQSIRHGETLTDIQYEYMEFAMKTVPHASDYMEFFPPEDERPPPCTPTTMKQTDKFVESSTYVQSLPGGKLLLLDIQHSAGILPAGFQKNGTSDIFNVLTLEQPPYYKITPKCLGCSDSQRPTATKHECEKCSDGSNNTRQQCVECSNPNFSTRNTCTGCSDDTDKSRTGCLQCSDGSNKDKLACHGCSDNVDGFVNFTSSTSCTRCSDGSDKDKFRCKFTCSDGSDKDYDACAGCSDGSYKLRTGCLQCSDGSNKVRNQCLGCSDGSRKTHGECVRCSDPTIHDEQACKWCSDKYGNYIDIGMTGQDRDDILHKRDGYTELVKKYTNLCKYPFKKQDRGTCVHKIENQEQCKMASWFYGFGQTLEVVSRPDWLSGCYLAGKNDKMYFNGAESDVQCGTDGNECLCLNPPKYRILGKYYPILGRTFGPDEDRSWGPNEGRTWGGGYKRPACSNVTFQTQATCLQTNIWGFCSDGSNKTKEQCLKYSQRLDGECQDKLTKDECEEAATFFNLPDTTAEEVSRTDWLSGCYFAWNDQLYFNTAASDIPCGTDGNECLCKVGTRALMWKEDGYLYGTSRSWGLDEGRTWGPDSNRTNVATNNTWGRTEGRTWGPDEGRTWGPDEGRTWGADSNRTWGADSNRTWGADNGHTWGPIVSTSQQNCSGTWYPVENFSGYVVMRNEKLDWKEESSDLFFLADDTNGSHIYGTPYGAHLYANETYRNMLEPVMFQLRPGKLQPYYQGFANMNVDQCHMCGPGQYQDERGKNNCKIVTRGQYVSIWGEENLTAVDNSCPPGTRGVDDGTDNIEDCRSCSPGQYQTERGKHSCVKTLPGWYTDQEKSSLAKKCAIGKYQNEIGQHACKDCGIGKTTDKKEGMSVCTPCPKGKYATTVGGDDTASCAPCVNGYRCPLAGMPLPYQCRPGTYAGHDFPVKMLALAGDGVITYNVQDYNTFIPPSGSIDMNLKSGAEKCIPCTAGFYQDEFGKAECKNESFLDYRGSTMDLGQLCKKNDGGWKTTDENLPAPCRRLKEGGYMVQESPPEFKQELNNAKVLFTRSPRFYSGEVLYYEWDDEAEQCIQSDGDPVPPSITLVNLDGTPGRKRYLNSKQDCLDTISNIVTQPVCIRDTYVQNNELHSEYHEQGVSESDYRAGNATEYSYEAFELNYRPKYVSRSVPMRYEFFGIDKDQPCPGDQNSFNDMNICKDNLEWIRPLIDVTKYDHPHEIMAYAKIECEKKPGLAPAETIWEAMTDFQKIHSVKGQSTVVPHAWVRIDPRGEALQNIPPKQYVPPFNVLTSSKTARRGYLSYDGVTEEECPTWDGDHWLDFEFPRRKVLKVTTGSSKFFWKSPGGECQMCPLGFFAAAQTVPGWSPALREENYLNGGFCGKKIGVSYVISEDKWDWRKTDCDKLDQPYRWISIQEQLAGSSPCQACQPGTFMPEGNRGALEEARWGGAAFKCTNRDCDGQYTGRVDRYEYADYFPATYHIHSQYGYAGFTSTEPMQLKGRFGRASKTQYFRSREPTEAECNGYTDTPAFCTIREGTWNQTTSTCMGNRIEKLINVRRSECESAQGTYHVEWRRNGDGFFGSQTILRNMLGGEDPEGWPTYFTWEPHSYFATHDSSAYKDGKPDGYVHSCYLCPPGKYAHSWGTHTECIQCSQSVYDSDVDDDTGKTKGWVVVDAETERYGWHWMAQQGSWACAQSPLMYNMLKWAGKFFEDYAAPLLSSMIFNTLVGLPASMLVQSGADMAVSDEMSGYSKGKKYCAYIKGMWDMAPPIGQFLNFLHAYYGQGTSVGLEYLNKVGTDNPAVDKVYEGCQTAGSQLRKNGAGAKKALGAAMEFGCGMKPQLNWVKSRRWFTGRGYDSTHCEIEVVNFHEYGYWKYYQTKDMEDVLSTMYANMAGEGQQGLIDESTDLASDYNKYGALSKDKWDNIWIHPMDMPADGAIQDDPGMASLFADVNFRLLGDVDTTADSTYPYSRGCRVEHIRGWDQENIAKLCGPRTIAKCTRKKVLRCGLETLDSVEVGIKPNFPTPKPMKKVKKNWLKAASVKNNRKNAFGIAKPKPTMFQTWKSGSGKMFALSTAKGYVNKARDVVSSATNAPQGTWQVGSCPFDYNTERSCTSVNWKYFASGYCLADSDPVAINIDDDVTLVSYSFSVSFDNFFYAFVRKVTQQVYEGQQKRCESGNMEGCNVYHFSRTHVKKMAYYKEKVCYDSTKLSLGEALIILYFTPAEFWSWEYGLYKNPSSCSVWSSNSGKCHVDTFLVDSQIGGTTDYETEFKIDGIPHSFADIFARIAGDEDLHRGSLSEKEIDCDDGTNIDILDLEGRNMKDNAFHISRIRWSRERNGTQHTYTDFLKDLDHDHLLAYMINYRECIIKGNDWEYIPICLETEGDNAVKFLGWNIGGMCTYNRTVPAGRTVKNHVIVNFCAGGENKTKAECNPEWRAPRCVKDGETLPDLLTQCDCEGGVAACALAAFTPNEQAVFQNPVVAEGAKLATGLRNSAIGALGSSSTLFSFMKRPNSLTGEKSWNSVEIPFISGVLSKGAGQIRTRTPSNSEFDFYSIALGLSSSVTQVTAFPTYCLKQVFAVIGNARTLVSGTLENDGGKIGGAMLDALLNVMEAIFRCKDATKPMKGRFDGLKKLMKKELVKDQPKSKDMSLEGGHGAIKADCWEFYVDQDTLETSELYLCGESSNFNTDPYEASADDDDAFDE